MSSIEEFETLLKEISEDTLHLNDDLDCEVLNLKSLLKKYIDLDDNICDLKYLKDTIKDELLEKDNNILSLENEITMLKDCVLRLNNDNLSLKYENFNLKERLNHYSLLNE